MKNILNVHYLKLGAGWTVAFLVIAAMLWVADAVTPRQHNPFRALDLADPIGLATYDKLTDLKYSRETCFAALDAAGIAYTPLEDRAMSDSCGFFDALTLDRSATPYSAALSMTCAQSAALYIWETQVARPLAEELLGSPIARIETYGSYSCRTIAGSRRFSEHARANAIDVSGFRLADGRLVDVKSNWGKDTPEGRFLRRAHRGACRLFSVTLGPDYNVAHADHFHMDMGSGGICR